jgi:hypothetical protein
MNQIENMNYIYFFGVKFGLIKLIVFLIFGVLGTCTFFDGGGVCKRQDTDLTETGYGVYRKLKLEGIILFNFRNWIDNEFSFHF